MDTISPEPALRRRDGPPLPEPQRHVGQVHDKDRGVLRAHRHPAHREGVGDQGLLSYLQPREEDPVVAGHVEMVGIHGAPIL